MLGLTGGLRDCVRRFAGRSVRDHEGKAGGGSSSVFPAPESERVLWNPVLTRRVGRGIRT